MLLLGIDSSGRQGSVALLATGLESGGDELRLLGLEMLAGRRYSEVMLPAIVGLLERHGFAKNELGLIGVAAGPGSFTGLRVGIATVKGLAEVWATPVVAVSVLEAIALRSGAQGRVLAALDAQRSELFFGEYEIAAGTAKKLGEDVAAVADFVAKMKANAERVVTPDATLGARLEEAGIAAEVIAAPTAEDIARIAYRRFLAGERADLTALDANYLRRSDAELFSAPKLGIPPRS